MKNLFILILLILSISCQKKEIEPPLFCENELQLFKTFDSLQKTNFSIVDFRDDYKTKLDSLFRNSESGYTYFQLNLKLAEGEKIPLAIRSYNSIYDTTATAPFTPKNYCKIYLTEKDSIFINFEKIEFKNVNKTVEDFYFERGEENYQRIHIAFYWDKNVDKKLLTEIILESLKGYTNFAQKQAMKVFKKSICELTKDELIELYDRTPFQFRFDFVGDDDELTHIDFSPYSIYNPPPPPMEEKNDDNS